jgi:hypothetical protein
MVRRIRITGFALAWVMFAFSVAASGRLDIPPRKQWVNQFGYCGECSIQQAALYYGTYVSQYRAREIIDPTQWQDVWVPENSGPIFTALRLRVDVWDQAQAAPQYPAFLVWMKKHLQQGHPVIFQSFVRGEADPGYDHIMTAVGFTSIDTTAYHAEDRLFFTDHYWSGYYNRSFGSLHDTRDMSGNGSRYEYCIPRDRDGGCAVTGIKDASGTARRIVLKVDRWREPNISRGALPVMLTGTIAVSGLVNGKAYALLRYDNYRSVPTSNFLSSAFTRKTVFTASAASKTFIDWFKSDGIVIYRCVPLAL